VRWVAHVDVACPQDREDAADGESLLSFSRYLLASELPGERDAEKRLLIQLQLHPPLDGLLLLEIPRGLSGERVGPDLRPDDQRDAALLPSSGRAGPTSQETEREQHDRFSVGRRDRHQNTQLAPIEAIVRR